MVPSPADFLSCEAYGVVHQTEGSVVLQSRQILDAAGGFQAGNALPVFWRQFSDQDAHDALNDVRATVELCRAMCQHEQRNGSSGLDKKSMSKHNTGNLPELLYRIKHGTVTAEIHGPRLRLALAAGSLLPLAQSQYREMQMAADRSGETSRPNLPRTLREGRSGLVESGRRDHRENLQTAIVTRLRQPSLTLCPSCYAKRL